MPIRPQPMRVRCPHCHWHTIVAPRSDAIRLREWVTQCPRWALFQLRVGA